MKNKALAALGVVGACAACCAVPLAVPLLGGATVSGLALLGIAQLPLGVVDAVLIAVAGGVAAIGAGVWFLRQRRKHGAKGTEGASCTVGATKDAGGCACSKVSPLQCVQSPIDL